MGVRNAIEDWWIVHLWIPWKDCYICFVGFFVAERNGQWNINWIYLILCIELCIELCIGPKTASIIPSSHICDDHSGDDDDDVDGDDGEETEVTITYDNMMIIPWWKW